jgi:hypothetical protein
MATTLGVRRSTTYRVLVVAALSLAVGFLLSWVSGPPVVQSVDQPATPANELSDAHTWATTGCTIPGASIDAVPTLFDFRHACIHHGGCYLGLDRHGSPAVIDRLRCDQLFRTDLEASCKVMHGAESDWRALDCENTAEAYYDVARSFGGPYYAGSGNPA